MTLIAAVLNTAASDTRDRLIPLAFGGYIRLFTAIGIHWFRWDPQ